MNMKTKAMVLALLVSLCAAGAVAQDRGPQPPQQSGADHAAGHAPPPQAYEDCVGKKAGEAIQHTTREGKVAATCVESPKGLVARPNQPRGAQTDSRAPAPQSRNGARPYSISTALTGDSGEAFLAALNDSQRRQITGLVGLQRQDLAEIVRTRRAISTELRRFLTGDSADKEKVLSLSRRYGELDGELSYLYATAFAQVGKTLTGQQKDKLVVMRASNPAEPKGPFLYSSPIRMPEIRDTNFLFGGSGK
jgi:Spy/CpxP family protein refolding chaperone